MQPAPRPPMSRAQKLSWYAQQLISDAEAAEKAGDKETATARYLQAAEILLLLSKVEANYATWRDYTDKASLCQRRARLLIAQTPSGPDAHAPPNAALGGSPRS